MHKYLIYYSKSLSISSLEGIELAVPILVVEIPAKVLANFIESIIDCSSQRAAANAPEKASPAPEVSMTSEPNSSAGSKCFILSFWKKTPWSPNVTSKFFTPKSKNSFPYFSASFLFVIFPET